MSYSIYSESLLIQTPLIWILANPNSRNDCSINSICKQVYFLFMPIQNPTLQSPNIYLEFIHHAIGDHSMEVFNKHIIACYLGSQISWSVDSN